MFEFLLQRIELPGELARMAIALLGTGVATYYDVRSNRTVPDKVLYAFLAVSLLANLVYFQQDVFIYGIATAAFIFAAGYLSYRLGYVGEADVYVLSSLALLLPVFPSGAKALFNFPPAFSIIITSCLLFALYFFCHILLNIALKGKKGRLEYLLLVPVYVLLMYFIISTGIFGIGYVMMVSILLLSSMLFLVYKQPLMESLARKTKLSEIEEGDLAAPELMPETVRKYGVKRLLDAGEIRRLGKLKVKEIYVYKELPPFLPFVLLALLITILVGDLLTYSITM
ncbi:MAG: hypothetical protein PHS02_00700 [Candidatus ainarchaeum sp.]|nr:hypothetical protein [Candidatus ainarchaeum sp.]